MTENTINHIIFAIDKSQSMTFNGVAPFVPKVFDNQIKYLARRSQELDQETRVSIFLFGSSIECVVYDKDVLRLPSLETMYRAQDGSTKLIDAAIQTIEDFEDTPTKYGDHSFLLYVITDGEENDSDARPSDLSQRLNRLTDNWTVAVFVPNQLGVREAKSFGFPTENISVWDATSAQGLQEVGRRMEQATDSYMEARSTGMRGTKSLFTLDMSKINTSTLRRNLDKLKLNKDYVLLNVGPKVQEIRPFVKKQGYTYQTGNAYYQLSKREHIQEYKQIAVMDNNTNAVYAGDKARQLLSLPDYKIKVDPDKFSEFTIFVQSTSVNRKLMPNTQLLYMLN
jgi:hypothetical protein